MKANLINEGAKYGVICGLSAVLLMYGSWAYRDWETDRKSVG